MCIRDRFLGGTIGNLGPEAVPAFLSSVFDEMDQGDSFLLGVQLITDADRLEAAYNDSAGLSAAFNKNMLHALQPVLGAAFDPEAFDHVARFNQSEHRIEMHLRSVREQVIPIPELELTLHLEEGEEILTEISTKYTGPHVEALLTQAGFLSLIHISEPTRPY